jgi:hypothetical protein
MGSVLTYLHRRRSDGDPFNALDDRHATNSVSTDVGGAPVNIAIFA